MSLLLSRHYGFHTNAGSAVRRASLPDSFCGEQWMGVYYGNRKIGYTRRRCEKRADGYRISEMMKMDVGILGAKERVEMTADAYLDPGLKPVTFELSFGPPLGLRASGRAEGGDLHLTFEIGGRKTEQVIPLADVPSAGFSLPPGIIGARLAPGRKFSASVFDPATLSRVEMHLEVLGRERIATMGQTQQAFKIRGDLHGAEFYVWITEKGEIIREESPMGFVLVREKKEDAAGIPGPSAEAIGQVSVSFNLRLPENTRYLRVRLSGLDLKGLDIDGGRQNVTGDVLEVRREDLSVTPSIPERLRSTGEYLRSTFFVQSDDPRIIALAEEIAGRGEDKLGAAQRLYRWVYTNVEKAPSSTLPMATEVLKTKQGDCNEHTTLFTALSRAAGIPTRMALGLVYREGSFYYHAWPEIFIGRWIAVDPTLGQFPADAAHIRLISGDIGAQMRILGVIGKIKIEGIEYR